MDREINTLKDSNSLIDIDKPFKLSAGPGSGKTSFLINHINNIIKNSNKISTTRKILCITYTNIARQNISDKVISGKDYVDIETIHSFLYKEILKPFIWVLNEDFIFDIKNIKGHTDYIPTYSVMKEWANPDSLYLLNNQSGLSAALNKMTWISNKENGEISLGYMKPYESKVDIKGKNNKKNKSYPISSGKLQSYKDICWSNGIISHDDVLYLSYLIINKAPRVLDIIRLKYPYILMDEFQDTNLIQTDIIKKISNQKSIIGVVGDKNQSIYAFAQAEVESFINFQLDDIVEYKLLDNHRSSGEIVTFLNKFLDKQDKQKIPKNNDIKVHFLIGDLNSKDHLSIVNKDEDLIILTRYNDDKNELEHIDNNFDLKESEFIFSDHNRSELIFYIIQSLKYAKDNNFGEAIKSTELAYRKHSLFKKEYSLFNLKRLLSDYDNFSETNIVEFYNKYIQGHYGVMGRYSRGKVKEKMEKISYKNVESIIRLNDEKKSNIKTIHSLKGMEFDTVIIKVCEKKFENFLLNPNLNENEEHRVYYVACSRAKQKLYINIPNVNNDIRKKLLKKYNDCVFMTLI